MAVGQGKFERGHTSKTQRALYQSHLWGIPQVHLILVPAEGRASAVLECNDPGFHSGWMAWLESVVFAGGEEHSLSLSFSLIMESLTYREKCRMQ